MNESETEVEATVETKDDNNENLMAALAYVLGFLSGAVIFLIEKDKPDKSRFVIFHAMQSIVLSIVLIVISILLAIIAVIPIIGWIIAIIAGFLYPIVVLILWLLLIYKAYSGEEYRLPVLGEYAVKYAEQYG